MRIDGSILTRMIWTVAVMMILATAVGAFSTRRLTTSTRYPSFRTTFSSRSSRLPTLARFFSSNNSNNINNGFSEDVNGFSPYNDDENKSGQPSKSDLYSNDELQSLLNLHQSLQDSGGFAGSTNNDNKDELSSFQGQDLVPPSFAGGAAVPTKTVNNNEGPLPLGLHDMVLQTLQDMQDSSSSSADATTTESRYEISNQTREILRGIRAIASDVDGTLISSDQTVHARTQQAIQQAIQQAFSPLGQLQYFFVATGKTRAALTSLGSPEPAALLAQCPGVFVQGLYCVDAAGNVVYEQKLNQCTADAVIEFGQANGLTVLAYDGDKIFTTRQSNPQHIVDIHQVWGEPEPIVVDNLLGNQGGYHKCLLWCDDSDAINNTLRPQLEALTVKYSGTVTQAIPTMLEVLPPGSSKAVGVQKLCEYLGIDMSTELLAIGDAENDVDFLRQSAFGVAVGNAVPAAKQAANLVLEETNNQGGAGIAIDLFGLGGALR